MLKEFIEYINYFMSPEEIIFGIFGLICIIAIWIAGRNIWEARKRKEFKGGTINVFRTNFTIIAMDWYITRATKINNVFTNIHRLTASIDNIIIDK